MSCAVTLIVAYMTDTETDWQAKGQTDGKLTKRRRN